ncbi:MAG: tetratricopeptide repeat protein [Nitrospinae bacterium]|nr:tetratricopeptide repeat protein [Nitrospinota bacterium]
MKGNRLKALIISEKSFETKQLREFLQSLPFSEYDRNFRLDCYEMDSAKNALDKIEADAQKGVFYDFAIVSHLMKKLTGLQFAQLLAQKKKLPPVNIILLASAVTPQLKEEGEKTGVQAILQNPVSVDQLREAFGNIADAAAEKALQQMEANGEMLKMSGDDNAAAFKDLCNTTVATLKKCVEMAPWRRDLNNHLAKVYIGGEDYANAIPILKNLIKFSFTDKEAHKSLALCYKRTGKSLEDAESLRELIEARPGDANLHYRLAQAYRIEQGGLDKAEEYFRKALGLHGANDPPGLKARAHYGLAKTLFLKAGEKPGYEACASALAELKNALRIDPAMLAPFFLLHAILKNFGKDTEAAQALEAAKKITPALPADWLEWFFHYMDAGDTLNAEDALQKALVMDTENQAILVLAGEVWFRRQNYDKAIALFEKAVAINPSDPRLYNWLGISCRRMKQGVKAMENYKKALIMDPDDFNLHYNLGRVHFMLKDYANARKSYEEALRLNPDLAEAKEALAQLPATL